MARKPATGTAKGAAKAEGAAPPQVEPAQAALPPPPPPSEPVPPMPKPEPEPVEPERRLATATTHISYDWRGYDEGEQLAVTRADFEPLARVGAVLERTWDDCAALPEAPPPAP